MKFFFKRKDGGPLSTVTGYWLVEIKWLFSIVLLRFDKGSREAYHSHAFNALTWFLCGHVAEYSKHTKHGRQYSTVNHWVPSLRPKYTRRSCLHRVIGFERTWALSIRGPWSSTWQEYLPKTGKTITLTHGRKEVRDA